MTVLCVCLPCSVLDLWLLKKIDKKKFNKYIKILTGFVQVGSLVGKTDESKHLYKMK